jgi:hypothetical protein
MEGVAAAQVRDELGAIDGVLSPIVSAVREVAKAHAELCNSIPHDVESVIDGELWQGVRAYREAVADLVLCRIHSVLETASSGSAIGAAWLELIEALAGLAEGLEETAVLPESPDLFTPDPEDSAGRRVKKRLVRGRRAFGRIGLSVANRMRRLFRKELRELRAKGRTVPLRQVLEYHLVHRLPRQFSAEHERHQRAVARYVAKLERALARWTNDVYDLEVRLDRPRFHDPAVAILSAQPRAQPAEEGVPGTLPATAESPAAVEVSIGAEVRGVADAPAPAAPAGSGALAEWRRIADSLQRSLTEVVEIDLELPTTNDEKWTVAWEEARGDFERCGTALLTPDQRRVENKVTKSHERIRTRQASWTEWHERVANRLGLAHRMIRLRERYIEKEEALLQGVADATLSPVHSTFETLKDAIRRARVEADGAFGSARSSPTTIDFPKTLEAIQYRIVREMHGCLRGLGETITLSDQALSEPGKIEWERMCELIDELPELVVVHVLRPRAEEGGEDALLNERKVAIELRDIARGALSPGWPSVLAEPADPLRHQIVQVWGGTEQIQNIVQYNFGAAIDELTDGGSAGSGGLEEEGHERTSEEIVATVQQLADDALRRSSDTLDELLATLSTPWGQFTDAVFATIQQDWADLVKQVRAEGIIEERLVEAQTRFSRWRREAWRRVKESSATGWSSGARVGRALRRRVRTLIRHGQSAVGVVEAADGATLGALEVITSAKELREKLPLVYRRLFTLEPLSEPTLLEGRARDLVRVRNHLTGWQTGHYPGAIALTGALGSGRTSFLHALRDKVFDECDVREIALVDRIQHESELAAVLARALGTEPEAGTLGELEERLLAAPRSAAPVVVTIDDFEHLLLQMPGGSRLIQRALIFFSRTDTRVLWVAAVGSDSWEFVRKTAAGAASCLTTYQLSTANQATVQKIIANRHRRSGMTLRFREPSELSPILRQRLRRTKTDERKQQLLSDAYFDALYRESGESVMLALFYWLRSVDVDSDSDSVEVNPLEPLDFRFLSSLDLTHSFSLKAFLLHYSLTLDEHRRIFRMSREQSTYIFEALLSLRIIEPSRAEEPQDADGGQSDLLVPDRRYRIKPLVLHPVRELLRSRHILY